MLLEQPVKSSSDIAERPPDFLERMQIFKVELEKIMVSVIYMHMHAHNDITCAYVHMSISS